MVVPANRIPSTLILIRGVPGSGKSYLAMALEESFGKGHVLILDPDKVDLKSPEYLAFSDSLTKDGVELKFHPYRWSRAQAYDAIKANKIIIWNQAFTHLDGFNKTVINLQTYATDHGVHLPLLVVEVEIHEHIARQRVAEREQQGGHGVPSKAFARFINDYRSFSDEGFNTITVDGQAHVAKSVDRIKKALQTLWNQ